MTPPIFSNRPNRAIPVEGGGIIWHSRSLAVVAELLIQVGGQRYVLLNQRGPACPDHVGQWTLPCGYLDWDESAPDAVRREVWEESGFDVHSITPLAGSLQHPWHIASAPHQDARQNVVLHYGVLFAGAALPEVTTAYATPGECTAVRFWPVEEALAMDLAFGHQHDLAAALRVISQTGTPMARAD